jgi:hypothetical protein
MDELKDMIDIVLRTTAWVSEDNEARKDIRSDVEVLLLKFLDRHEGFDQIRDPSNYLFKFLQRNIWKCLNKLHPKLKPDPLPPVEQKGWTKAEGKATKSKREQAADRKKTKALKLTRALQWLKDHPSNANQAILDITDKELGRWAACEGDPDAKEKLLKERRKIIKRIKRPLKIVNGTPVTKTETLRWAGHQKHPRERKP